MFLSYCKKTFRPIFLIITGICFIQYLQAQTENWKSVDWQLGVGKTYLFDDYLSPLPHEGSSYRFSTEHFIPLKWGLSDQLLPSFENAKWFSQFCLSLNPVYAQSAVGSSLLHVNLDIRNSVLKQIIYAPVWSASVGGYAALSGGGRYCIQNGNNPGSIDAMFDLGMTVMTSYGFSFRGKRIKIRYLGSLALAGLAFSPEYAESYYEIFYLKNYRNIIRVTSLNNKQLWKQQFSMDIPLSGRKSSLRLSYWNEGRVSLLNNIRTRVLSNHFSAGYIRYFSVL